MKNVLDRLKKEVRENFGDKTDGIYLQHISENFNVLMVKINGSLTYIAGDEKGFSWLGTWYPDNDMGNWVKDDPTRDDVETLVIEVYGRREVPSGIFTKVEYYDDIVFNKKYFSPYKK